MPPRNRFVPRGCSRQYLQFVRIAQDEAWRFAVGVLSEKRAKTASELKVNVERPQESPFSSSRPLALCGQDVDAAPFGPSFPRCAETDGVCLPANMSVSGRSIHRILFTSETKVQFSHT